ncbi:transcription factor grauzone-like [Cydia pomonella]|uniref:transcription factor grauzone-like n=1 Tax=Cydia pomonella TaxID=82600 RepID=UPI002ADD955D|nr:transcription factor grauzone-like [Cydia pomonella]
MAPPFVACRICRSVEGKLRNYTDNTFLIKAYEEFSGCPFVEWPYMTKFCPECACLIRKVYKFRRKCRKSYKFVMQHLESGRKITKQFIQQSGTSHHKSTDLSTWNCRNPTIDYTHNPKTHKTKKKSVEESVCYIKHLTVPKETAAEIPAVVPEPIYDVYERFYDSSDLEEEQFKPRPEANVTYTPASITKAQILDTPEEPVVFEEPPMAVELTEPPELEAPMIVEPVEDPVTLPEELNVAASLCKPDLIGNEEEIDVKMEDDMINDISEDQIETKKLEMKLEPDLDPDNLTLLEIKAEMERVENSGKEEKRKKRGKEREDSRMSKKSQQLQKRARRNQSNQELEEHFTITQFLTEEEQVQEFLKRKMGEGYLEGKFKCELCLKSFKEQKWMDAHKQKHEPSAGSYKCTICHIRCRTPKLYRTHRDSNHTTRYSCRRCQFFTYSKAQALKHHGWHEGVEHTCQHCGATFRKHTTYMGHLRRAHPSAHICGVCARSFVSAYGLNLHIKAVHKDINKLENDSTRCDECDVTFVSRQMYVRHLLITERHKEMSKDILGCRKCGEQFESAEEMEKHTHYKERKYVRKDAPRRTIKCDECSEVFSHPNGVYQHYLREHPDTPYRFAVRRHYLCEQCGKTFKVIVYSYRRCMFIKRRVPALSSRTSRHAVPVRGKTALSVRAVRQDFQGDCFQLSQVYVYQTACTSTIFANIPTRRTGSR